MTRGGGRPLRVALLHHDPGAGDAARVLARALDEAGHVAELLTAAPLVARAADRLLRRRRFESPLAHVPFSVRALLAGDYDVAHAFSSADAVAAHAWRRLSGRPTVLTCRTEADPARLADRRLRLDLVSRAVERSDAVVVASQAERESLARWLALEAAVIPPGDAQAHAALYRSLTTIRA